MRFKSYQPNKQKSLTHHIMSNVTLPTNHKEIADALFAVKDKLTDATYKILMNLLDVKNDVPDITDVTNAKVVLVDIDLFKVCLEGDDAYLDGFENCRKMFNVCDENGGINISHLFDTQTASLSKDLLKTLHEYLTTGNTRYNLKLGGSIRVNTIKVIL